MNTYIKINPLDEVAVALVPLTKGATLSLDTQEICLLDDIPQGHKFSIKPILKGASVYKYGAPIGLATKDIAKGEWVHTHNLKTGLDDLVTYSYKKTISLLPSVESLLFQGYRRPDGKVGVRNEIWIIPTNGCVNKIVTTLEYQAQKYVSGSLEKIASFPHPYGCSQMGEDQENTRRILAGLINHPNAGAVLVLGLGCENTSIEELKKYLGSYDSNRVRFLVAQESEDEVAEALSILSELAKYTKTFTRESIPCSELIIGTKCGGSDGLSGITANPAVGLFSDMLISQGGTTILTEVPEMFGAETLLMNRCVDESIFEETVKLINDFKSYFKEHDQVIYDNPSPGNKEGGISTLEDKSLGCTQKSGTAPVNGVLAYGEPVKTKGLNLLSAPGNDLIAATALAASGAHIVLFTTGRGTPFACPIPTLKISSNSTLHQKKDNWIDFNCGSIVENETIQEVAKKLFDFILETASGRLVKSEKAGYHDLAIFKTGVTL